MRAAHGTEMRLLRAFLRQGFVVEFQRLFRVQRQVELILPAEFEAGLGQGIVAGLGAGMAFGQVGGMGGDFVGDDAVAHVLLVGQAQMLLRGHIAQHRRAIPADHRRADGRGDVVVAGGDVGGQRPQGVERRFVAMLRAARPCCP